MEKVTERYHYICGYESQTKRKTGNYFSNSAKIIRNGNVETFCPEELIKTLCNRINKGTITNASKKITCNGKKIEFTFIEVENNQQTKIIINIPYNESELSRFDFIEQDICSYDKLTKITKKIKILKEIKNITLILGLTGLIVATSSALKKQEEKEELPTTQYEQFYEGVMSEQEYNDMVNRFQNSYGKTNKK